MDIRDYIHYVQYGQTIYITVTVYIPVLNINALSLYIYRAIERIFTYRICRFMFCMNVYDIVYSIVHVKYTVH